MEDADHLNIYRPVVRYHGGKFLLAPWIISHFPKHKVYVEAFGGGASVLMQKSRSYAEVYNDQWDTIVNVFKVLRDPEMSRELKRRLRLTPFSRTEFNECSAENIYQSEDIIEKARLTIFRSFAGFGSASVNEKYATGFRANSNRSGTTPAGDWVNYPDNIDLFTKRLSGVVIENKNYFNVIEQHDSCHTLVYLDPPYLHSVRNMAHGNASYKYELSDKNHQEMIVLIKQKKSMFVLSGYDNELYNDMLIGWEKTTKDSFADGARKRTECIWRSPNCSLNEFIPENSLFDGL